MNYVPEFTIYFDSRCPLCVIEMRSLKRHDRQQRILLVDINDERFTESHPQIDKDRASEVLHGVLANGEMLLGLDVSCQAWTMIGRKSWLRLFRRWPLRAPSDLAYKVFARNRYRLSWLLTGSERCDRCSM